MCRPRGSLRNVRQRLLKVERLCHGLRDAAKRLQLGDAALRTLVQARILNRLGNLAGNRLQELDLIVVILAGLDRAYIHGPRQALTTIQDRHGEETLKAAFGQVGKLLEAGVEVRIRSDRHRLACLCCPARQTLADPHPRWPCRCLDMRAVHCLQNQLVRRVIVRIDEARIGSKGARHRNRDGVGDLCEVERAGDGRNRLREQAEVPYRARCRCIRRVCHAVSCRR